MKKNECRADANNGVVADAELAELNRRFHKYEDALARLNAEYKRAYAEMDDRFCAIRRAADVARGNFNLWRKRLPKTRGSWTEANSKRRTSAGRVDHPAPPDGGAGNL